MDGIKICYEEGRKSAMYRRFSFFTSLSS